MTNKTRRQIYAQQVQPQVFRELDEMFTGLNSWGSATFVRDRIRIKFDLTYQQAKDIHLAWVESRKEVA